MISIDQPLFGAGLNARHFSYALYAVLLTAFGIALMQHTLRDPAVACLQTSIGHDAADTLARMSHPHCRGEPFASIVGVVDTKLLPSESSGPEISQGSARAWTVFFAAFQSLSVSSAIAGAVMAVVTSLPDIRSHRGWLSGAGVGAAGVAIALVAGLNLGSAIYVRSIMLETGEFVDVRYGRLLAGIARSSAIVSLVCGAVMAACLVAVGHEINGRTGKSLTVGEFKHARTTASLVLAALAATLSLGVLATGARNRLLEQLPGMGEVSGLVSILYGAQLTAIVAALYVPTQARLGAAREALVESHVRHRGERAETLTLYRQVREELDAGSMTGGYAFAVLGPIVTATASAVVG